MKKEHKEYLGKLIVEFFSIVIAVLLALLANRWYDGYKDHKRLLLAVQSIRHEISTNLNLLESALPQYRQYLESLPEKAEQGNSLLIELYQMENKEITNRHRIVHLLSAWESSRSSGVLEHMDPNLAQTLTGMEKSVARVEKYEDRLSEVMYSLESFSTEDGSAMFHLYRSGMNHIVFEHDHLVDQYKKIVSLIDEIYGSELKNMD